MTTITTAAEHPGRLYVAGPMTGHAAFNYAAGELRVAGYEVENPADNQLDTGAYRDYLRAGLAQLQRCGGVAALEGWWLSGGARWEVQTAGILGLPVRSVDEWLRLADPRPAQPEPVKPSREDVRQAIEAAFGPTWDSAVEQGLDAAADAVLALLPGRCAPTEEDAAQAIESAMGDADIDGYGSEGAGYDYLVLARAALDLFAAQPTVREAKAEAVGGLLHRMHSFLTGLRMASNPAADGLQVLYDVFVSEHPEAVRSEARHG